MSKFYGTVIGQANTCGTRRGSTDIRTAAQSYDGSIITKLYYDDNEVLKVRIGYSENSDTYTCWKSPDFVGTFEDFKKLLQLAKDIKDGNAKVIHHRKK